MTKKRAHATDQSTNTRPFVSHQNRVGHLSAILAEAVRHMTENMRLTA